MEEKESVSAESTTDVTNTPEEGAVIKKGNIEYLPELEALLVKHQFSYYNIKELAPRAFILKIGYKDEDVLEEVEKFKLQYDTGSIFTLPGGRRDGVRYLIYTRQTKKELMRLISLGSFL